MIDLQTAADGVGKLRVRHVGGSDGILTSIAFAPDGAMWRGANGVETPMSPPRAILTAALDDGGKIEAPQASFEPSGSRQQLGHVCTCGDCADGFIDACKYEEAVRKALGNLSAPMSVGNAADARRVLEAVVA